MALEPTEQPEKTPEGDTRRLREIYDNSRELRKQMLPIDDPYHPIELPPEPSKPEYWRTEKTNRVAGVGVGGWTTKVNKDEDIETHDTLKPGERELTLEAPTTPETPAKSSRTAFEGFSKYNREYGDVLAKYQKTAEDFIKESKALRAKSREQADKILEDFSLFDIPKEEKLAKERDPTNEFSWFDYDAIQNTALGQTIQSHAQERDLETQGPKAEEAYGLTNPAIKGMPEHQIEGIENTALGQAVSYAHQNPESGPNPKAAGLPGVVPVIGGAPSLGGMAKGLYEDYQNVMDVGRGLRSPTNPEAIKGSTDIAGTLVGTGTAFAPEGSYGVFGGKGATGFERAQAEGRTRATPEGPHEFEISDQMANWRGPEAKAAWDKSINDLYKMADEDATTKIQEMKKQGYPIDAKKEAEIRQVFRVAARTMDSQGMKFSEVFKHDEVLKNYPEFADLKIVPKEGMEKMGAIARANISKNQIELDSKLFGTEEGRSAIIHELNHFIQEKEGFAVGSSPVYMMAAARDVLTNGLKHGEPGKDINYGAIEHALLDTARNMEPKFKGTTLDEARQFIFDRVSALDQMEREIPQWTSVTGLSAADYLHNIVSDIANRLYQNSRGEVTSRNAQKRIDYTDQQRIDNPPSTTEEVPLNKQLILKRTPANKSQASMKPIEGGKSIHEKAIDEAHTAMVEALKGAQKGEGELDVGKVAAANQRIKDLATAQYHEQTAGASINDHFAALKKDPEHPGATSALTDKFEEVRIGNNDKLNRFYNKGLETPEDHLLKPLYEEARATAVRARDYVKNIGGVEHLSKGAGISNAARDSGLIDGLGSQIQRLNQLESQIKIYESMRDGRGPQSVGAGATPKEDIHFFRNSQSPPATEKIKSTAPNHRDINRLWDAMDAAGNNSKKVAETLGISQSTLGKMLNDRRWSRPAERMRDETGQLPGPKEKVEPNAPAPKPVEERVGPIIAQMRQAGIEDRFIQETLRQEFGPEIVDPFFRKAQDLGAARTPPELIHHRLNRETLRERHERDFGSKVRLERAKAQGPEAVAELRRQRREAMQRWRNNTPSARPPGSLLDKDFDSLGNLAGKHEPKDVGAKAAPEEGKHYMKHPEVTRENRAAGLEKAREFKPFTNFKVIAGVKIGPTHIQYLRDQIAKGYDNKAIARYFKDTFGADIKGEGSWYRTTMKQLRDERLDELKPTTPAAQDLGAAKTPPGLVNYRLSKQVQKERMIASGTHVRGETSELNSSQLRHQALREDFAPHFWNVYYRNNGNIKEVAKELGVSPSTAAKYKNTLPDPTKRK